MSHTGRWKLSLWKAASRIIDYIMWFGLLISVLIFIMMVTNFVGLGFNPDTRRIEWKAHEANPPNMK